MTKEELKKRIENDFMFHPADEDRGNRHAMVRAACKAAADRLIEEVPEGRELSLALTKLEEAMMWANAGIARQQ